MITRVLNLAKMLRNERISQDALRRIQETKFQKLFRHAYDHVPFYYDLYRANGISINDIQTLADIQKLPVVSKEQLRNASVAGRLWDATHDYYCVETSGSSGTPFRFYVNRHDNKWRKAQYLLPYISTGRRPWDSILRFRHEILAHRPSSHRVGLMKETLVRSDMRPAEQYQALIELRPDHVQGYPSVLRLLALHILDNQLSCPVLKKVYTDSEVLFPKTRALLKQAFRTDVIDVFGSYETDNIAYECSVHDGYHLVEDSVIVESIASTDSESTDGTGELVCTVLHNVTTPFIRYNLGDLVEIESGPCRCGRTSRRLSVLKGRVNDLITLPDATRRDAHTLISLCNSFFLDAVKEFQIRQLDTYRFEIQVVTETPLERIGIDNFASAFSKAYPHAQFMLRPVATIERTAAGKYKAFVGLEMPKRIDS